MKRPQPTIGDRIGFRLDRAIALVAPELARKRVTARARGMMQRALLSMTAYDTSRSSPLHERSKPPRIATGRAVEEQIADIRDDARDLVRKDVHAAALARVVEENVVGSGIRPQSRATPEATGLTQAQCEEWNEACDRVFAEWAEHEADATGEDTFWSLQRQVVRGWKIDGEAFAHRVPVPLGSEFGRRLSTAFELIEPERIATPNGASSGSIRSGIELGARGQVIAYHVLRFNPDDRAGAGAADSTPVAKWSAGVRNMVHVWTREGPGQFRGVSLLAPTILTFRTLHKYLEAELAAAAVAACFTVFIRRSGGNLLTADQDPWAAEGGTSVASSSTGGDVPAYELRPGLIEQLGDGEDISTFQPNRPGATFAPFVERLLRGIGAAVGLPYELLVRDFSRTNYSSARAALLETRRGFRCDQSTIVAKFCVPARQTVLQEAFARGMLPSAPAFQAAWVENPRAMLAARWIPPAWGWIDPTKEIEASTMAISAGLSTLADEAAGAGTDWRAIAEGRARELRHLIDLEDRFELPRGTLANLDSPGVPAATSATPTDQTDQADDSTDDSTAQGAVQDGAAEDSGEQDAAQSDEPSDEAAA